MKARSPKTEIERSLSPRNPQSLSPDSRAELYQQPQNGVNQEESKDEANQHRVADVKMNEVPTKAKKSNYVNTLESEQSVIGQ